jgi:hypothetical protein
MDLITVLNVACWVTLLQQRLNMPKVRHPALALALSFSALMTMAMLCRLSAPR